MSVVPFRPPSPPEAELMVWACNCGCLTFRLLSDGTTECAHCKNISNPYDGRWFEALPEPDPIAETVPDGAVVVTSLRTSGAALKNVLGKAEAERTAAVIIIQNDGGLSVWSQDFDSPETAAWFDRQLASARDMALTPERKSK